MATYVLIHGAWHGGLCWEMVVPLLAAKGHRVVAPDSPGMGEDRTPWVDDTLAQWIDATQTVVEAQAEPVVFVGHSRGTILVSAVTGRIPERVGLAVFLAGPMLADGEALADVKPASTEMFAAIRPSADGRICTVDPEHAPALFYNRCAPDMAARALGRLTCEPMQPHLAPMQISDHFGRVPRAYIETTEDRAVPLPLQRKAQARWPCNRVMSLPSDHSPFYSMPEPLAEVLDGLAPAPRR